MPPLQKSRKFFKYLLIDYSNFSCLNPKGYHREPLQIGMWLFSFMPAMWHRYQTKHRHQTQAAPGPECLRMVRIRCPYPPLQICQHIPRAQPSSSGHWSTASDWLAEDHVSVISLCLGEGSDALFIYASLSRDETGEWASDLNIYVLLFSCAQPSFLTFFSLQITYLFQVLQFHMHHL